MQIVEILIILTICIVFIVYTQLYTCINNCNYYPKYKWSQYYKLKTNTTNSIFIFYNFIRKHNRLFISIPLSNNYNSICYFFRNFAALYPLETYIII